MDVLEFPTQVQKLLLKKEQEYGPLKFISSRATEETSCFIDELLEEIRNIAEKYNLYDVKLFSDYDAFKSSTISPHVISNYNHFLLNTNFSSQPLLVEDMLLGHIVNFWPTLSPYLFVQIMWHMKYEDLLIESLVHLPLDLCVDILDVTIRCINELEIPRARRLIFLLISKLYLKCQWLHLGTLAERDLTELVQELVAHFQTLLDLVSSKLVILKSSDQEKYVRHGILLKNILRCIKTCMSYKTKNFPDIIEMIRAFEITYGTSNGCKNHSCKLPVDEVKSVLATLDQELITLLLNQIKQVDCFEFMEWAEVDDDDDDDDDETISISLQRALIIKCHNFMEFMKQDEILSTNDHLLHCLEQLVGPKKPEESILTLDELCRTIENGNLDNMKELLKHYKKWNLSVLQFVSTKTELLNTKDVGILLEYLHYMFANAHIYEEEQQAYMLISKVLMQQELLDMYYVVLRYTLQHFHDTRLESLFNNVHFKNLIESNVNMRDHQKFRVILIFTMLNPKKVLTTLVRVAIGSTKMEYRNVMFKRPQMYFLYPFLVSKVNDESNLLTYLLNDAWLHDHSTWHYKEFEAFMNDTLEKEILTPDDLINNVYIPYLTYDVFNYSNLLSVLIHMYYILKKRIYTDKMNCILLIIELTRKISLLRKCNSMYLRSTVNNLLDRATMILNFLFTSSNLLTSTKQSEIMNKVNNFVEPIDQILLAPLLQTILRGTVQDVIQNYERRVAAYQLSVNSQCEPNTSHDCMYSSKLDRKVLLRHMMLHATEEEYKNFAIEMTVVSWPYFGWANELVAYENVLHITAEAVQLALVFTDTFSKDTAVSLLRALMHYCNALLSLEHQMYKNQETMFNILSKTLFSLQSTMRETQYDKIYDNLLEQINDMRVDSNTEVTNYFRKISELIEEYFVRAEKIDNGSSDQLKDGSLSHSASTTSKTADMFKEYQFVRKCIDDTAYRKKNISQVIIE